MAQEVKLAVTRKDRELYENMADLYSIIRTTEELEKMYIRDAIPASEYTPACMKLIAKFKSCRAVLEDSVPDISKFMDEYHMNCPAARKRLLEVGVPATTEFGGDTSKQVDQGKAIAETVQHFITAMDSLKLNMVAVDELQPIIHDLMDSINRIVGLPESYDGIEKIKYWLLTMNKMKASDQLNEDQQRQMTFDLDQAYHGFHRCLQK
uniref:Vacuolar protein sorting-associated protein 28 homolog n=1 Tax=Breviata anathema TaxID=81100 RepID=E9LD18_BREAA|nr:vacuolar protein sorting protein 28 [Breviata anathema]